MTITFEMRDDVCVFVYPKRHGDAVAQLDALLERRDSGVVPQTRYLRALEKLAADNPWFIDGHAHIGTALYEQGRFDRALAAYRRGYSLGTDVLPAGFQAFVEWNYLENRPFLRAAHGVALCQLKLGRSGDALSTMEKMLAWNPDDNQGIRYIIGSEYLRAGHEEEARSFFETEAAGYPPYRYELALLLLRRGMHATAATSLRLGFVENPYIPEVLCGNPDPLPVGISHHTNLAMPELAKDYASDYGGLWRDTPHAIAFLRWLHSHPRAMAERAAFLDCSEALLWERDSKRRASLLEMRRAIYHRIDDALSKEIVVGREDPDGRAVSPWLYSDIRSQP